jgi:hypothetical protein
MPETIGRREPEIKQRGDIRAFDLAIAIAVLRAEDASLSATASRSAAELALPRSDGQGVPPMARCFAGLV